MSTVITAGNATNGLSLTPDNTGAFEFKTGTGAGTTALTLSSAQVATFAGAASVPGNLSFNSGYGSAAVAYGCRAWVNFNGTGTVAIRASGNVTSITDNGTGEYTVNFTSAITDANYATVLGQERARAGSDAGFVGSYSQSTASVRINTRNIAGTLIDFEGVDVAVFR
jgi:hypothetical protein